MLLSPSDVLERGLEYMKICRDGRSPRKQTKLFGKHYGVLPEDVADIWYDLCDGSSLTREEKSEKGFKRCMIAFYWLWDYPKNTEMLASRFGVNVEYCRGRQLWKWIKRMSLLEKKKIVWDETIVNDEDTEVMAFTMDGIDHKVWEIQHDSLPYDKSACSHKFKSAATKYVIVLSVFEPKCLFIAGPYKRGVGDLDVVRKSGLLAKLRATNKIVIVDRGFHSKIAAERRMMSFPDQMDSAAVHNHKSRARLRHETFNGRLKKFDVLNQTFRHGFDKHGITMRAIATIVQYHMDNGHPLFDV